VTFYARTRVTTTESIIMWTDNVLSDRLQPENPPPRPITPPRALPPVQSISARFPLPAHLSRAQPARLRDRLHRPAREV
jgi:hypothetical protein